jgi:hypothetical protein
VGKSRTPCVFTRLSGSPSLVALSLTEGEATRARSDRRDEPASAVWVRRPAAGLPKSASAARRPLLPVRSTPPRTLSWAEKAEEEEDDASTRLSGFNSAPLRNDMQNDTAYVHAAQVAHSARQPAPLGLRRPTVRFAVCLSPRSLIRHDLRWACMFPLIEWHECPPRAEHGYLLTRWRTVKTKKPREHVEACAES